MKLKMGISILFAWVCIGSTTAMYAPEYHVSEDAMPEIKRTIAAFKSSPKLFREAYIAEKLRLCFSPSGGNAYGYDESKKERGWFTYSTAHFVGSDGKVYPLWATLNRKKEKREEAIIAKVKAGMDGICPEAVFAGMAEEITQMCIKTAKNRLDLLPSAVRDCFIAEKGKLLYLPGEETPYTGARGSKKFLASDIVDDYEIVRPGVKYVDSKGVEGDFHEVKKILEQSRVYGDAWGLASLCVKLVGAEEIILSYVKEWEAMRKYRKMVAEGTFSSTKKSKKDADVEVNPEIKPYISALKALPKQMREAYIAERLGLCFTSDGTAAYEDKRIISTREGVRVNHYHVHNNARFVGSNGKEYGLYESQAKKSPYKKMIMEGLFGSAEEAILSTLSKEVNEMVLCTVKNRLTSMPPRMRYAFLAEEGDLLFMTDGKSAYTGGTIKRRVIGTKRIYAYRSVNTAAKFHAPDGSECEYEKEVQSNWARYEQAWLLAKWCATYIGKEKVLALFADEYEAMKSHSSK